MKNISIISVFSKKFSILLFALTIGSMQISAQAVNGEIVADTANMTVIKLWGTSYERGFAYGFLMGDKIIELLEGFTIPYLGGYWSEVKSIIAQGDAFQIDSVYWNEAQALIDGITAAGYNSGGYTSLDVIAGNCVYDFASWPLLKKSIGSHCSTFINWNDATIGTDLDGQSVIARHGDGNPDSVLTANFVIVIHIPIEENLQPWLHMGYVGEMASTANLNSSGYFISANGMYSGNWSPDTVAGYEPIIFTMRKAMETFDYNQDGINNLIDIKDIISSNQNGYSDGSIFTCMGPSTSVYDSLIAIMAEVAPEAPFITFRTNSYEDSIPGDNLYAANSQIARNNAMDFCWRYENMIDQIGPGTNIGSQDNWDLMKTYSNMGNWNLYFLQFVPELDQLKICVHQNNMGAYLNDPVTFDLSEFWIAPPPFGIRATENQIQNIFYPNPAQNEIRLYNPEKLSGEIIIYSLSGQQALNIKPLSESINISNIPTGMYIVEVTIEKRKFRQKLLVQR